MAATKVDTVVIGAGVVGIAVARALAVRQHEVLLVDAASRIGSVTSSRNSEVIHAGLYYPTHSLKAKLCVQGKKMLYDFCQERSVDYKQCGKLVVATSPHQLPTLSDLHQQAIQNGVTDTKLLTADDVKVLEPHVESHGALWSLSTGILDSHSFMVSLLADAEQHGTTLALHTKVEDAKIIMQVNENNEDCIYNIELYADGMWLSCTNVINCAGLWADKIATMIHKHEQHHYWQPPKQYFCKGSYFRLQGIKSPFQHLIYPVPEQGGLGVHATIDLSGLTTRFGPDVEWLDPDTTNPDDIDYRVDEKRAQSFYAAIRKYWPDLPDDDSLLVSDYAGVRPKLNHPSSLAAGEDTRMPFQDFWIVGPEVHGVPRLVHLLGIESPGLTSAMAIGEYVAETLES